MILALPILTQSFGSLSTFQIVRASVLVASNMKTGAQGACNTVNELDSGEGRVVALGRRNEGAWEPDSRSPIKYGTAFHLFRLSERRVIPGYLNHLGRLSNQNLVHPHLKARVVAQDSGWPLPLLSGSYRPILLKK